MTEKEIISEIRHIIPNEYISMTHNDNCTVYFGKHINDFSVKVNVVLYKNLNVASLRFYIKENDNYKLKNTILVLVKSNNVLSFLKEVNYD